MYMYTMLLYLYVQAQADGDRIWGVISCASNSDGHASSPITAPSSELQARLIRKAMQDVGVTADMIGYFEMHGEYPNIRYR